MIKLKVQKELGKELFSQALSIFLTEAGKDMMLLNLYCESKDYTNAKMMSHKLLGTFNAIGVKRIPTILKKIDDNLKDRYFKKILLTKLNEEFIVLKAFIKKEFKLETEA